MEILFERKQCEDNHHLIAGDWFESHGMFLQADAVRLTSWSTAVGEDQYGVYADLRVGEAKQRLRYIMPGSFMMGSPENEEGHWDWNDEEQRPVTIPKGFWMADTPSTQLLWSQVMKDNPSRFKNNPNNPVERVSWDDVQEFCAKLGRFAPGLNPRLPSEAQWEYACRAGTATARYGELDDIAWHAGNSNGMTHPVGLKEPNPWRLFDMLGNVEEWCANMEQETREWGWRAHRGGSWRQHGRFVRAASRTWCRSDRIDSLSFRFVVQQEL